MGRIPEKGKDHLARILIPLPPTHFLRLRAGDPSPRREAEVVAWFEGTVDENKRETIEQRTAEQAGI